MNCTIRKYLGTS